MKRPFWAITGDVGGLTLIFRREKFSLELVDEIMPLLKMHFAENARNSEFYGEFDPSIDTYSTADANGALRVFTVKEKGNIVGYQTFFVCEHPHSQDLITATQDVLYISPTFRRGMIAFRFIKWCAAQLAEDGIGIVHQVVPARKNYGSMFQRLGYQLEDMCYSMRLNGGK